MESLKTAHLFLRQDVLDRFDLVSWDPRGVGATKPDIDCIDNYDTLFDGPGTPHDGSDATCVNDGQIHDATLP